MANTTNLNLVKPAGTDKALVSVLNSNSDKIDAFAGTTNQALSNVNNALSGSNIINNQSDKDLNHYVETSAWRIGNISQLTNGPVWTLAGATGDLYVRANGSYISQLFIGNAGLASRLSADGGSTWNDWAGYALKSDANRETITSRLSSSYGTITAYESFIGNLCAVAITFKCTTAIAKNTTFITGLKASQVNRAPVVAMYNTDDGKIYHATVSSSGELTSHVEALPTGDYRMSFAYVT